MKNLVSLSGNYTYENQSNLFDFGCINIFWGIGFCGNVPNIIERLFNFITDVLSPRFTFSFIISPMSKTQVLSFEKFRLVCVEEKIYFYYCMLYDTVIGLPTLPNNLNQVLLVKHQESNQKKFDTKYHFLWDYILHLMRICVINVDFVLHVFFCLHEKIYEPSCRKISAGLCGEKNVKTWGLCSQKLFSINLWQALLSWGQGLMSLEAQRVWHIKSFFL